MAGSTERPRPPLLDGEEDKVTFSKDSKFSFEPDGIDPAGVGVHEGSNLIITSHRILWQTDRGPWVALKLDSVVSTEITGGWIRSHRVGVHLKSGARVAVKCPGVNGESVSRQIQVGIREATSALSVQRAREANALNQASKDAMAGQTPQATAGYEASAPTAAGSGMASASSSAAPAAASSSAAPRAPAKAAPPKPAVQLTQMQAANVKLDDQIAKLDGQIAQAEADAKEIVTKNPSQKNKALMILKRKKMYEQQREQLIGTQMNMTALEMQQEQAEITLTTVTAMKAATEQLKAAQAKMGVDEVETLMDDLQELADNQREISEAVGRNQNMDADADDELAAEYARMEEEQMMETLMQGGVAAPAAPAAPVGERVRTDTADALDLMIAKLEPAAPATAPTAMAAEA